MSELKTLAEDFPITGNLTMTGSARRIGRIEGVQRGVIRGWVWSSADRKDREITVQIDGIVVGTVLANMFRADLVSAGVGDGHHGFEFVVPSQWRKGKSHEISLTPSLQSGHGSSVSGIFIIGGDPRSIDGRVERVVDDVIIGWVYDRALPHDRVELEALVDGVRMAACRADRRRDDLIRAKLGDGHHGYHLKLPRRALDAAFSKAGGPIEVHIATTKDFGAVSLGTRLLEPPARFKQQSPLSQSAKLPDTPKTHEPIKANVERHVSGTTEVSLADKAPPAPVPPLALSAGKEDAPKTPAVDLATVAREVAPKLRSLPREGLYLHSKFKRDRDQCNIQENEGVIRLSLAEVSGWNRLLWAIPSLDSLKGHDWDVKIRLLSDHAVTLAGHLLVYGANGAFVVAVRLARKITLNDGENDVFLTIKSEALTSFLKPEFAGRPAFIALEVDKPFGISIGAIDFAPAEEVEETIPYRRSDLRSHMRLVEVNRVIASTGKREPEKWMLDTADVAVRLECFETASKLIRNVNPDVLSDHDKRQYLVTFAEVALAEGAIDELRGLLLANYSLVATDDHLFTALSLCFPAEARLVDFFHKLPSRRLNRSYIARTGLTSAAMNACLSAKKELSDDQDHLLLASVLREVAPAQYVTYWNDYLSSHGLVTFSQLDPSASNVLATARFNEAASAPHEAGKVSVIMSAYNAADTIQYSVESILNQTYGDIELLICDDCSTDATLDKLFKFGNHPRVRVFRSVDNQGPYNIRNALLERATGKFATFQDADDVAHPERIARQVEALATSQAEAVIARWIRIRPNGEIVFFRDQRCLRMCVVSLMAERSLFQRWGGYRQVLCGGDSELFEQLRTEGGNKSYVELNLPLLFGLWSNQSLTQQNGLEATEDGYRSPARRQYAELAARRRLLGADIVPGDEVDAANQATGIFRPFRGVRELGLGG